MWPLPYSSDRQECASVMRPALRKGSVQTNLRGWVGLGAVPVGENNLRAATEAEMWLIGKASPQQGQDQAQAKVSKIMWK